MKRAFSFLGAVSVILLSFSACATGGPGAIEPFISLEKVTVPSSSAVAGGAVSPDPLVRVTRSGSPLAGASVRFRILAGEGALTDTLVVTGPDGMAATGWLLGPGAGPQAISAQVENATVEFSAMAMAPTPGASYLGRDGYVEYLPGELPIILSAPHGGSMRPEAIPDRTHGTLVQDANTEDLSRRIAAALHDLTGKRPHLIITHLHRRKVDTNREIVEAAQGNRSAERVWHEFHAWIETARHIVARDHGRGFYVDVHGHGHPIQRLELGYLLSSSDLGRSDAELNQPQFAEKSSIRTLAQQTPSEFSALLRGERSLGEILTRNGYPSVPSHTDPDPAGAPYFSGGYNTARYGSRSGGPIDAVQLEANFQGVRDTPANREAFARAFAEALLDFLGANAGISLAAAAAAR